MEVILREEIEKLGRRGDVVKVAAGYARNYLLPKRLAVAANESNKKIVEQEKQAYLRRESKEIGDANDLAKMMGSVEVTIAQKAGENDQLFGSVTAQDIVAALEKAGYTIDRKKVNLAEPIKALGDYKVTVKLHREVSVELPVHVIKPVRTNYWKRRHADVLASTAAFFIPSSIAARRKKPPPKSCVSRERRKTSFR
jgi:large subunit ribosomal protein L9